MHEKLPDPVPATAPVQAAEAGDPCSCACKQAVADPRAAGAAADHENVHLAVHYDIGEPGEEPAPE